MRDALTVLGPLFGFMLLPVWIPILAVAFGWLAEQLGSRRLVQSQPSRRTW